MLYCSAYIHMKVVFCVCVCCSAIKELSMIHSILLLVGIPVKYLQSYCMHACVTVAATVLYCLY